LPRVLQSHGWCGSIHQCCDRNWSHTAKLQRPNKRVLHCSKKLSQHGKWHRLEYRMERLSHRNLRFFLASYLVKFGFKFIRVWFTRLEILNPQIQYFATGQLPYEQSSPQKSTRLAKCHRAGYVGWLNFTNVVIIIRATRCQRPNTGVLHCARIVSQHGKCHCLGGFERLLVHYMFLFT